MAYPARHTASRARLLTAAEERVLARTIEQGSDAQRRIDDGSPRPDDHQLAAAATAARTRFIEANIGLVLKLAGSFKAPAHVDRDDLIQDGMIGLERAVDRFDWRKGYKFSTYATWWIRQGMQRGLENTATTIRIPAHRHSELRAALATDTDGSPIPTPVSSKLAHLAAVGSPESLDLPLGDGGTTLGEVVPSDLSGPDSLALDLLERREIHRHVGALDPVSAMVVTRRFGLDGSEPATFSHIGASLGVSAEAARRRVQRALDRLRQDLHGLAA